MHDHAAFLATIFDRPDDDGPRLVYADWLEERGECGRAEFIRAQCKLATPLIEVRVDGVPFQGRDLNTLFDKVQQYRFSRPAHDQPRHISAPERIIDDSLRQRSDELLAAHANAGEDWMFHEFWRPLGFSGPAMPGIEVEWCRGMIEGVSLTWADCAAHLDAILAAHPVQTVRLTTRPTDADVELDRPLNSQPPWPRMRWRGGKTWMDVTAGWPSGARMRGSWVDRLLAAEWPRVKTWHLPTVELVGAQPAYEQIRQEIIAGLGVPAHILRGDTERHVTVYVR